MISLLRELIARDFWLKLFSLALAVLIWLTISFAKEGAFSDKSTEQTFHIPVRVVSGTADVSGLKPSPQEVDVKLRGAARILHAAAGEIRALVDLSGIPTAMGLRKHVEISMPAGLTAIEIIPAEVDVTATPN